jgi:EAL domain-containing protein (putative c-di-GMP-specific phosphodiesterase class I)
MPQIVIEREEGSLADRLRPYKVIIDGHYRGTIRNKEKWAFAVPAGTHTVSFRIDYYCSPPLKVVVVNRTRLMCRSSVAHAFGLMALFAPSSWISVREEDEAAAIETQYPEDVPVPATAKKPAEPRRLWRSRRNKAGSEFSFRLSGPKTDPSVQASRLLEMDLREAVASRAFDVYYEPQINLLTNKVAAFEALLRWQHPVRGLVPAREFIKIAERLGLIEAIGQQVLEEACQEASHWPEEVRLSVNVSEHQLIDSAWPAIVEAALTKAGLHPSRLELEVSASVALRGNAQAMAGLWALREAGVRIAIDVFGAEGLQLADRQSLAFDKAKIRRTLTKASDAESAATVAAILKLCAQRNITSCAVGVETPEQLTRVISGHCQQAQGHLFGQALAARDIPGALARLNLGDWAPGKATLQPHPGVSFFQIAELANDVFIVTNAELDAPGPHIGRSPRILQGAGTSRATLDVMREAMREGRVAHEKLLNYTKTGQQYWLDVRVVPLRAVDGTITHYAAIERDITQEQTRQAEPDFQYQREEIAANEEPAEEFAKLPQLAPPAQKRFTGRPISFMNTQAGSGKT